jgi:hypothetical protein
MTKIIYLFKIPIGFDNTLFISFVFRYYKSGKDNFIKLDYLFFLPNLFYLILEVIEIKLLAEEYLIIEVFEVFWN